MGPSAKAPPSTATITHQERMRALRLLHGRDAAGSIARRSSTKPTSEATASSATMPAMTVSNVSFIHAAPFRLGER